VTVVHKTGLEIWGPPPLKKIDGPKFADRRLTAVSPYFKTSMAQ